MNSDICLTLLYSHKLLKLPLDFVHAATTDDVSNSAIVGHDTELAKRQHFVVNVSRTFCFLMSEYSEKLNAFSLPTLGYRNSAPDSYTSTSGDTMANSLAKSQPSPAIETKNSMRSKNCRGNIIRRMFPMPVFIIVDEEDEERKRTLGVRYRCVNVTWIPHVIGNSSSHWRQWLSHHLSLAPGFANVSHDHATDEIDSYSAEERARWIDTPWDGMSRRPFPRVMTAHYQDEVNYLLTHLRAIALAYGDNNPSTLILEDDLSLELLYHWEEGGRAEGFTSMLQEAVSLNTSSIQLAVNSPQSDWDIAASVALSYGKVLVPDLWYEEMGAYILTKQGAEEVMALVFREGKFSLKAFRCIDAAVALPRTWSKRRVLLPPVFVRSPRSQSADSHSVDSDATALSSTLVERRMARKLSRETVARNHKNAVE
eukprot:gene2667-3231_t